MTLAFDEKIFVNTFPVSPCNWRKFLSTTWKWSYGSKTALLPFSLTKVNIWYIWMKLWIKTVFFAPILVMWWTLPLTLGPPNFRNGWHYPYNSFFIDKSSYMIHLNGVLAPKLNFYPYFVMWWPWPLTCEKQNLIRSLFNCMCTFHTCMHAWTHRCMDRWTTWKHNAAGHLKWVEAWQLQIWLPTVNICTV